MMITTPADKVLLLGDTQIVKRAVDVRAKIWDDKGVVSASMHIDGELAVSMDRIGETQMWRARFEAAKVSDGNHKIMVKVTGAAGNKDQDVVTVTVNKSGSVPQVKRSFGPEGNSVGRYTEKGLMGNHITKSGYSDKGSKSRKP